MKQLRPWPSSAIYSTAINEGPTSSPPFSNAAMALGAQGIRVFVGGACGLRPHVWYPTVLQNFHKIYACWVKSWNSYKHAQITQFFEYRNSVRCDVAYWWFYLQYT